MKNPKLMRILKNHPPFLLATLILSFSLPFFQKSIGLLIILWISVWMLEGNLKDKFNMLVKNQAFFWALSSVFWVQLIGLFLSVDLNNGWFQIEKKLSLFIFPLVLATVSFSKQDFFKILNAFCYGALIAGALCIIRSFALYSSSGDPNLFFYKSFSYFMHPSYFGMYINTACLVLLVKIHDSFSNGASNQKKAFSILLLCFAFILIILINSKAAILTLGIVLILYFLKILLFDKKGKAFLFLSISMIIIFLSLVFFFPKPVDRISLAYESLKNKDNITTAEDTNGTRLRLMIWEEALDLVKEKPILGYGTGSSKSILTEKYKQKGMSFAEKGKYNAHNQFLQSGIENGILGIISLLALILIPAFIAFKYKNFIALGIPILIGINFLFESILGLQSGIIYTGFFLSLITFAIKNNPMFSSTK